MASPGHLSTETLADRAEGLLREADAAAVDAHVASCEPCRAEAALLAALPGLLAADDPGPMPAVYAARLDAALAAAAAERAAAAPTPGPAPAAAAAYTPPAAPVVADVVDLAARRRSSAPRAAGRVTSVAASIVLLLGGTVLGLQALNNGGSGQPGPDTSAAKDLPPVSEQATVPPPAGGAKPDTEPAPPSPLARASGKTPPKVPPKSTTVVQAPAQEPGGSDTGAGGTGAASTAATGQPAGKASGTASFAQKEKAASAAAAAQASPGPTSTADAAAGSTQPKAAGAKAAASKTAASKAAASKATSSPQVRTMTAEPEPYVEDTGSAYTPENFAGKVAALARKAGYGPPPPPSTPAPSVLGGLLAPAAAEDPGDMFELSSADAAGEVVADRVKRCAHQLGGHAVAGDTGTWRGEAVTIVVLPGADSGHVVGYAIAGPCSSKQPATDRANIRHRAEVALEP